jgi:acyl-CoA thioesterase-2
MPPAPGPEDLASLEPAEPSDRDGPEPPPPPNPIEIRRVESRPGEPRNIVWMRARDALPDDPLVHVCAVAYASDMTLLDSVLLAHGLDWASEGLSVASLDHAMWFHASFRADEWLLYSQESPAASGARGLAQGRIFRRDGRLVASVVQEGLIRLQR